MKLFLVYYTYPKANPEIDRALRIEAECSFDAMEAFQEHHNHEKSRTILKVEEDNITHEEWVKQNEQVRVIIEQWPKP